MFTFARIVIGGPLICLFAWSYPVEGSKPAPNLPASHETDRYIAEHPASYSIWEVHAAIERIKAQQ